MQYGKQNHVEVEVQAAGAVIFNKQNQVLLVQEQEGSKKGLWHIPSGTVENTEFPHDAAVREIEEETGLKLSLQKYLNTYVGRFEDGGLVLRHVWLAEHHDDQIVSPKHINEINDAKYFTKTEVESMYSQNMLRMYHTILMIEDAFSVLDKQA